MNYHNLYREINDDIFVKELGETLFNEYIKLFKKSYIIEEIDKNIILQKIKNFYKKTINNSKNIKNIIFNLRQNIGNQNNKNNQRKMSNFKQSIYLSEIKLIIQDLYDNIEEFPNFISILLYVAKQRKIIEVLKLNPNYWMFGLLRTETREIKNSRGEYKGENRFKSLRILNADFNFYKFLAVYILMTFYYFFYIFLYYMHK